MKKTVLIIFIIAAVFAAAGCTGKSYDLMVTAGGTKAQLDGLEKTFADFRAKTGITVKLTRAVDALNAKDIVTSQVNSKQATTDVLLTDSCYLQTLAAGKTVTDISKEFAPQADSFYSNITRACIRDGLFYAVPVAQDAMVMFYLKDVFEKAGVKIPETMAAVKPALGKVAAYHRSRDKRWMEGPFLSYAGFAAEGLVETFMALSGGLKIETDRPVLSGQGSLDALAFMRSMAKDKVNFDMSKLTKDFLLIDFMQARSVLMLADVSAQGEIGSEISNIRERYSVAKIPSGKNTVTTSICAAIPAYSRNRDKAVKLLSYLTSRDGQLQLALNCGYMPSLKAAAGEKALLDKYPHASWYFKYAEEAAAKPVLSNYQYVSERVREAIVNSVSGVKPAKEALAAIEKETTAAK